MKTLARSIFLVAAIAGTPPAMAQDAPKLRFAALNIEWLGNPEQRSGPAKNVAQDPKDIAQYIKASEVAILALEEISDDDGDPVQRTNKTLNKAFAELNAGGQANWKHRLFPKHKHAEDSDWQMTGIAWNEAVVKPVAGKTRTADGYRLKLKVPDGLSVGTPEKPAFERWATAMKFSAGEGKTDVVVIPLHLKSNRPAFPDQDVAKQREVEVGMLLTALADVRSEFSDDDFVLLGDINTQNKEEKAVKAFTAAGYLDQNTMDEPTYVGGSFQSPFDRAFVPNSAGNAKAKEFANPKFDVFKHPIMNAEEYRKKVSDHRMIRLTIEVLADDD